MMLLIYLTKTGDEREEKEKERDRERERERANSRKQVVNGLKQLYYSGSLERKEKKCGKISPME